MVPKVHLVPILRDNYCYLIEGDNKECIIVDPGQTRPVEVAIEQLGLTPTLIINTHHHADHVAGNNDLKTRYNISVIGPKAEMSLIPNIDKGLEERDVVEQSGITLHVISTPGHTNGHISFYCAEADALFCGDVIFSMGCGRLMEGTAEDLWHSIGRLEQLPPQTNIYCGHEYTESNGIFALACFPDNADIQARVAEVKKLRMNNLPTIPVTMALELKTNPFLLAKELPHFTELRLRKDTF